jgi:glutamine amidotransferase
MDKVDQTYVKGITNYGIKVVSIINKENIFGTQFHPEKSSKNGRILLKNFLEIK